MKLFIFYKHFLAYPDEQYQYGNFRNFAALLKIRSKRCWCRTYTARCWKSWCHLRLYSTKLLQEIQGRSHQPSLRCSVKELKPIQIQVHGNCHMGLVLPMDYRAPFSSIKKDKQKMKRNSPRFDSQTSRQTCENLQRTSCKSPRPAFLATNRNMWRKMDLFT